MDKPDFLRRWVQKERNCGFEASEMSYNGDWLLPISSAPCLSFGELVKLPRVWEVFSPSEWQEKQRVPLMPYRMIGVDGAGNPICVEESSGEVWLLDHEDWFKTKQFVNTTVPSLAECLLAYMGETNSDRFVASVLAADARAMAEHAFWWHEARLLQEE